jgi:hypothetical protein
MPNLRFAAFILLTGLGALGCSSDSNTPNDTGGAGGRGGTAGSGGTGGSTGGAGGGSNCSTFNYANYNPTMTPTLRNDIQPIMAISCALTSSCHQNGSIHRPHLGPSRGDGAALTNDQLQAIVTELTKPSTEVANRAIMVPNKPEDSFIMNKLEGTHDCPSFTCMGPDKCGARMPDPRLPLEDKDIELFRAWIKKGAPL